MTDEADDIDWIKRQTNDSIFIEKKKNKIEEWDPIIYI